MTTRICQPIVKSTLTRGIAMIPTSVMPDLLLASVTLAGGLGLFVWVFHKLMDRKNMQLGDLPAILIVFAVASVLSLQGAMLIADAI